MLFNVKVTGRRLSDNQPYELQAKTEAPTPDEAERKVLDEHDWDDANTVNVFVQPVLH